MFWPCLRNGCFRRLKFFGRDQYAFVLRRYNRDGGDRGLDAKRHLRPQGWEDLRWI